MLHADRQRVARSVACQADPSLFWLILTPRSRHVPMTIQTCCSPRPLSQAVAIASISLVSCCLQLLHKVMTCVPSAMMTCSIAHGRALAAWRSAVEWTTLKRTSLTACRRWLEAAATRRALLCWHISAKAAAQVRQRCGCRHARGFDPSFHCGPSRPLAVIVTPSSYLPFLCRALPLVFASGAVCSQTHADVRLIESILMR